MTHYLILTGMESENTEYFLNLMKSHNFNWNLEFAKKEKLCICNPISQACVRELRLFEIDVPTPATLEFEQFLGEWSFSALDRNINDRFLDEKNILPEALDVETGKFKIKKIPVLKRLMRWLFYRTFYKVMDKIIRSFLCPQGLTSKQNYTIYSTTYHPFSSIKQRFSRDATLPYKIQPQYNMRNLAIGKIVETPIGSFTDNLKGAKCSKCKKNISQH